MSPPEPLTFHSAEDIREATRVLNGQAKLLSRRRRERRRIINTLEESIRTFDRTECDTSKEALILHMELLLESLSKNEEVLKFALLSSLKEHP